MGAGKNHGSASGKSAVPAQIGDPGSVAGCESCASMVFPQCGLEAVLRK